MKLNTNKIIYFAFTGQGSFKPGFGKLLFKNKIFNDQFSLISKKSKLDLHEFLYGKSSIYTPHLNSKLQITHFALSWAMAQSLINKLGIPQIVLGHSLGEICALIFSEAISIEDGIEFVLQRGFLMEKASKNNDQDLLVVFNVSENFIQNIIKQEKFINIYISNINSSYQIVVAGNMDDLKIFSNHLLSHYKIRSAFLNVGVAFHSPLVLEAHSKLLNVIDKINFYKPSMPFFSIEANKILECPNEIKNYLMSHMISPVKWQKAMHTLSEISIKQPDNEICEIGMTKVLKGLFFTDYPEISVSHALEYLQ